MNAKLGGEPWLFNMPLKKTMVVGFDVYHGGAPAPGSSISAMVCSTTTTYGRYFSTLSFHDNRGEVSTKVGGDFFKCLRAYQEINNVLPERVVFYRDGVGEGQLEHVVNTELEAIKKCITETYTSLNVTPANLIYIIVTKKINARIFQRVTTGPGGGFDNPTPGTVVDDVITWPERYDFFLIAQGARQGTVSPTNYNVIYDGVRLEADKLQILSYKLCHGYYNWSGTVAVPAQCQYAHKLAYLTGMATKGPAHQKLNHLLYYL
jgi:aubergine-like protein